MSVKTNTVMYVRTFPPSFICFPYDTEDGVVLTSAEKENKRKFNGSIYIYIYIYNVTNHSSNTVLSSQISTRANTGIIHNTGRLQNFFC